MDIDAKWAALQATYRALDTDGSEALALALKAGAPVGSRDKSGESLLGLAVGEGKARCAGVLVAAGADALAMEPGGLCPARMVCRLEGMSVLEAMLDAGMELGPGMASAWGEGRALALLLARGADPNQREAGGMTPLLVPKPEETRARCVRVLLAAGADPNLADEGGQTPLMAAVPAFSSPTPGPYGRVLAAVLESVVAASVESIGALLEAGADPTARRADGKSALDICGGGFERVELAVRAGLASWEARQIAESAGPGEGRARAPSI